MKKFLIAAIIMGGALATSPALAQTTTCQPVTPFSRQVVCTTTPPAPTISPYGAPAPRPSTRQVCQPVTPYSRQVVCTCQ